MDETIRILLLEDNPVDVEMIEFELQEAGIKFILKWVMNEKDFIDAIKNYSPHVILSDYDLPQYNGALALAEAKTFCPNIPFILVTGALDEERAIDMLTSGAKDYVMKSRLHRLAPAVLRVLEEAREIRQRHTAQIELLEAYKTLESKIKKRTAKLRKEIKERKKTEKILRESQMTTNILLNSATDSIWMFDRNGDILTANNMAAERLGRAVPDIIGKKWTDFVPADSAKSLGQVIEEVIRTGRPANYKNERAGTTFDHSFYPVHGETGDIVGVTCFSRDITEVKKAEVELRHLASFPILNPNPVFEVNSKGQISYINPAAQRLFPDLEKAGSGHPLLAEWADISRAFQKENETQYEREVQINGKWYLLIFGSVTDTKGIVVYGLDITVSKTAEQELQDSRKRINTILNSITNTYIAFDRQWHVVDLNVEMEKLLGLAKEKLMGKVLWEVFPETPKREFTRQFQKAMDDNASVHFEAEFIFGKRYEIHAFPSAKGLVVYMRDITLQKQKEGSVQRSEECYCMAPAAIGEAAIAADI